MMAMQDAQSWPGKPGRKPGQVVSAEISVCLFEFYCAALALYPRVQALLLLGALVNRFPGADASARRMAANMRADGLGTREIASRLGVPRRTVRRWLDEHREVHPRWVTEVLSELEEYSSEELLNELEECAGDRMASRPMTPLAVAAMPPVARELLDGHPGVLWEPQISRPANDVS